MGETDSGFPPRIHRSHIAGTWYPGDRALLTLAVRDLLSLFPRVRDASRLVALVSPHAGLTYSGRVAASGYAFLESASFDTVILIGPSHFIAFPGSSVYDGDAFETPLGNAPLDRELAKAILSRGRTLDALAEPHEREHSLEMQVPFLQVLAPETAIVPIVMGEQDRALVDDLAHAVAEAVRATSRRILLVASSDLSHYKPASLAAQWDGKVLELIESFDADGLMRLLEDEPRHACGGGPIVAVMRAARELGARQARINTYGDSGDVTGDKSEVVGYVSAAFLRDAA